MKLDETPGYALCRIARKVHYQIDLIFKEEGMTVEQWVAMACVVVASVGATRSSRAVMQPIPD